uniref:Uncharacterized protein n=1 Tax=Glossina brevipalpis TaxID=37001 RepID=A0A1A9W0C0_9MUSC
MHAYAWVLSILPKKISLDVSDNNRNNTHNNNNNNSKAMHIITAVLAVIQIFLHWLCLCGVIFIIVAMCPCIGAFFFQHLLFGFSATTTTNNIVTPQTSFQQSPHKLRPHNLFFYSNLILPLPPS